MKTKNANADLQVPIYTLGTWLFGGTKIKDDTQIIQDCIRAIRVNINHGVHSIFTAQNYAAGYTEEIVGNAISIYPREEIILSTAIAKENSKYNDVISSFRQSLKRLKTDYIDILYHHCPDGITPIKDTMKAFLQLKNDGIAKYLAVSNYSLDQLKEAQEATNGSIIINQVYYNLFRREVEISGLLKFCQKNNILLQAFRPLEKGLLSYTEKYDLIKELCEKYAVNATQLALMWLLNQKNVILTCTTTDKEHLRQNLQACNIKMRTEDVENLRKNFPIKVNV